MAQLVPAELLKKSDKILFIAHLALGDFTYLQSCLKAFAENYPHIKIHIWVDEVRRTNKASEWEHLKKYSLYDWLADCPYVEYFYSQTYSPALYKQSIVKAQQKNYPIVVSLAVLRRHLYARLARKISPHGFVVGQRKRVRLLDILKHLAYRKLDATIPAYKVSAQHMPHISEIYAGWFTSLFGMPITSDALFPFVNIPEKWTVYACEKFLEWDFSTLESSNSKAGKVLFLNSFSKSIERSWPLERVIELIQAIRQQDAWCDTRFVVNVIPEELMRARALFDRYAMPQVHLFSAEENFFELPAILSLCDLIVSVETAVMHLANAVHVPVIALMRQTSPEWAPIDKKNSILITVPKRKDWVNVISVSDVMATLTGYYLSRLSTDNPRHTLCQ